MRWLVRSGRVVDAAGKVIHLRVEAIMYVDETVPAEAVDRTRHLAAAALAVQMRHWAQQAQEPGYTVQISPTYDVVDPREVELFDGA